MFACPHACYKGKQFSQVWLQKPGLIQEHRFGSQAVSNFTPFCPTNLIAKGGETDTVSACNTLLSGSFFPRGKVEEVEKGRKGEAGWRGTKEEMFTEAICLSSIDSRQASAKATTTNLEHLKQVPTNEQSDCL